MNRSVFEKISKHVSVVVNRLRCKICHTPFSKTNVLIDTDSLIIRSVIGKPKSNYPMLKTKHTKKPRLVLNKVSYLDTTYMIHIVCPICGVSRNVRCNEPMDNNV